MPTVHASLVSDSTLTFVRPKDSMLATVRARHARHAPPTRRVSVGGAVGCATAALVGALAATTGGAQAAPPSAAESFVPAPSPNDAGHADGAQPPLPLLTPDRRLSAYTHDTFGPGAFLGTIPGAALAQAFDTPREWGRGSTGYARRYASAFGAQIVRNTLLYGAGAAFHEDRRYTRLGEGGVGGRVGYALLRTAFVPTTDGGSTLCRSCVVAAVGTGAATSAWYPSRSAGGVARRAAGFAAGELVGFATGNLLHEFGPDVLHALGRIVHRGPRE